MKSLLNNSIVALCSVSLILVASAGSAQSKRSGGGFKGSFKGGSFNGASKSFGSKSTRQSQASNNTQKRGTFKVAPRPQDLKNLQLKKPNTVPNNLKNAITKPNTRIGNLGVTKNPRNNALQSRDKLNSALNRNKVTGKNELLRKPAYELLQKPSKTLVGNTSILVKGAKKSVVGLPHKDWCHHLPTKCHWWYTYCSPIRYCRPVDCVRFHCHYVTCNYVHASGVVIEDVRWYLGMSGIVLPEKGFAIETVEDGSPAALAGLQPGMVITASNGITITSADSMPNAIAVSNGILQATVLVELDAKPIEVTIPMKRLVAANF